MQLLDCCCNLILLCLCDIIYFICFFFNESSTTEIYTYLHTLSLHDALPIFSVRVAIVQKSIGLAAVIGPEVRRHGVRMRHDDRVLPADPDALRSEEHTSELQSLMRISYAIFCLKKTQKKKSY